MDAASQVLGHGSTLHGLHTHLLQRLREPAGGCGSEAPDRLGGTMGLDQLKFSPACSPDEILVPIQLPSML